MNVVSKRAVFALFSSMAFLGAVGCGGEAPPASKPAVVFPTREELAALPAAPAKLQAFGEIDTTNEPWTIQVEPSTPETPYADATPWGDFLRDAVRPHASTVALSSPLKCASQELARANRRSGKALPPMNLTEFVVARCGAVVSSPRPLVWRVDATADVTDDAILAEARKSLAPGLESFLAKASPQHVLVGLGVARDDKGASVVVTVANDDVALDPGPLRADANRLVSIRGTVRGDYASIDALVNQGALGVAKCVPQGDMPPPHFAFTCKVADGDSFAWLEIMGTRKGLVLSRELAAGIVTAGDDAPITYTPRSGSAPAVVSSPAELSHAIVVGVNRARAAAHLAPLAFDAKQSGSNARLVGTLVNASFASDAAAGSDRAAIGLLAGWDVTGMIRNATIYVAAIAPTRDATSWLDWALERPAGRLTLLDPSSRVIAVGPAVPPDGSGLGAAVTTYALFESDDHTRDEAAVYARIDAARAARGLSRSAHLAGFPEMHEHAVEVLKNGENPMTALHSMLESANTRSGQSSMGYVVETTDIDHFALPEIATRPGDLRISVAVTHHRVEGAAWGQYVVFLVAVGENVASPSLEAKNERARPLDGRARVSVTK